MIIYKVHASITQWLKQAPNFSVLVTRYEDVEEKPKTYVFKGQYGNKTINKREINQVEQSSFLTRVTVSTYCFEENLQDCITTLKALVIDQVQKNHDTTLQMHKISLEEPEIHIDDAIRYKTKGGE